MKLKRCDAIMRRLVLGGIVGLDLIDDPSLPLIGEKGGLVINGRF